MGFQATIVTDEDRMDQDAAEAALARYGPLNKCDLARLRDLAWCFGVRAINGRQIGTIGRDENGNDILAGDASKPVPSKADYIKAIEQARA